MRIKIKTIQSEIARDREGEKKKGTLNSIAVNKENEEIFH